MITTEASTETVRLLIKLAVWQTRSYGVENVTAPEELSCKMY